MNPILILRTEFVSLILLIYLTFVSRSFRMGKDGRTFSLILSFAMLHVIMDGVTMWSVNHPAETPVWTDDLFHIVLYLSAMLFSAEIMIYVANLSWPGNSLKIRFVADGLIVLAAGGMVSGLLTIRYEQFNGTRASTGGAPASAFGLCFVFFAAAIAMILLNRKRVGKHIRRMLVPMLLLLIGVETVQIFVREFMFTGAAITATTIGFFFSLENPAAVLEKKILMDTSSGLGSRSSYEHDIVDYDRQFEKDKSVPFTFVFIDINNLRSVNGLFGHGEGDAYIGKMATLLVENLRLAEHIYRMSGDEFLAIYRKTEEKAVVRDIQRVHDACDRERKRGEYHPELAIGYAVSDMKYNNLRDVLRVADYMMYRDKTAMKREQAAGPEREIGTRLNLYGLTDRVFDAMCLTSEEFYPYMTNLETNVTRVAPAMAEFFGLESEFIQDFNSIWMKRVHPADREGFEQDIRATMRGLQDYHFYKYRAMGKDGTYVNVTCRGGMYHGREDEPDIFSGYIVNHGAPQTVDAVTGLPNESALRERVEAALGQNEQITLLRIEIRNLSRPRMLYGDEICASIQRSVAEICRKAAKDRGTAYSEGDCNFIILLPGNDRNTAGEVFGQIRETCAGGVIGGNHVIPLDVFAGAVELPDNALTNIEMIRSAVRYISDEAGYDPARTGVYFRQETAESGKEDEVLLRAVHHDCLTDRSRFFLRLQPILDAQTERVTGAEALLRYESPDYGEVPPGRFISFLESDPAYTELGYDIIRMAAKHAGEIRKKLPEFNINVNITALQLYDAVFVPRVLQILAEEQFPPEHMILELTERCKEMEFDLLKQRVEEMRKAGLRVALDDMGTGFSTIDLLLHLDANEIKPDMGFTQQMRENENDLKFAEMLADMARQNNTLLCFEGVETEELRNYLKRFGKVLLQGFWFDKPLKFEEFTGKYC